MNAFNGKIMTENFGRPLIVKFANFPFSMTTLNDFGIGSDNENAQCSFMMQKNLPTITPIQMPTQTLPYVLSSLNMVTNPWSTNYNNSSILTINPFKQQQQHQQNGWHISIRNLPLDMSNYQLWEFFSMYGQVQHVNVVNKVTWCHGWVVMTSYDDAARAISALNGFVYGDRVLQVSFKSF